MAKQIGKAVTRIERHQHARVADNADQPEHADRNEPNRHDRAGQFADPVGALRLQREQAHQDQG